MYYIIQNYDIFKGQRCVIRAVPVDVINWALLKREGLTAVPCES